MTFVLAGCLTVLVVLIATLAQMFPLERTQVFLLGSRPAAEQVISIKKFDVNAQNLEVFKENFIKEYIVARNQIIPSNSIMRRKWRADAEGIVFSYSDVDVYSEFMKTDFWHAIMIGKYEPLTFRCDVLFDKIVPRKLGGDTETFAVIFRYVCGDESTGQTASKDFTIAVSVGFRKSVNWNERLDNPLGLKVVGYEPESGGEPLNPLNWL
jgi:type IV secretory pathway component VirB8